jgi:hypothetical protein
LRAELRELNSGLEAMSREDLILSMRRLIEECSEKEALLDIAGAAATEMSIQFQQIRNENAALRNENRELLRQNRDLTDQLQMRKRDLFGRKSEQSSGIVGSSLEKDPEDPIDESASEPDDGRESAVDDIPEAVRPRVSRRKKAGGKREADLGSLPTRTVYDLDVEDLDRRFGKYNWRISFWRREDTIESVHTVQYHQVRFRPVVSVGLAHELRSPYPCGKLLPGSLASESLAAEIMYQKVVQCVPSYRMEADFTRSGIMLSRQTMTNWINRFSLEVLAIVAGHMWELQVRRAYSQCDETPFQVIRDGRGAGSKSYFWVHTTSELDPCPPIIVFQFELTRKTEHLRKYYGDAGFSGNITSDAYCSYDVLEKEYEDIHGSGCLMHSRRRFHYAALVTDIKGLTPEVISELPEFKALSLADAISEADTPLKECTPEERLEARRTVVRPKFDAYIDYIRSLDIDDPSCSEKLRDAVRYTLNQEDKLRRFLDDPMIPADNGFCERSIRPLATARRNWLFSYSVSGAESAAILFTLVETAKANQAHPYYYLKYLLETLPKKKTTKGNSFLDDCMPWSESYMAYERIQKRGALSFLADTNPPEVPRTPRKMDRCG